MAILLWWGSVIAYWVIAFVNDSTTWWWWFVPIYGQIKIFGESVGLGFLNLALCLGASLGGMMARASMQHAMIR